MGEEREKIACHVCKKEIPKSAALHSEGQDYVYYFCNIECLHYWEENKKKEKAAKAKK